VVLSILGWIAAERVMVVRADDTQQQFAAQLDTGEFTLALRLARATPDPALRDDRLARIAAAQAHAGAGQAAVQTAGEIGDDRTLDRTLQSIRDQPPGQAGSFGGGVQPDFDALIELITTTIEPDTWDAAGGQGSIDSFAGGVYVDPQGVLRSRLLENTTFSQPAIDRRTGDRPAGNVRHDSPLRSISLNRLERQVELLQATGRPLSDSMRYLAGMRRIRYVLVYPESGDLVLAGPAGDWTTDREGRIVSRRTGQPVLQLDDLVVVLRQMARGRGTRFGCSITPSRNALARTQQFLDQSARRSLAPGERDGWLEQLRSHLGKQMIDVYGIDPGTRVARVLVEADYRMKLVGMGLEAGAGTVRSYLDLIEVPPGQAPPPLDVLRWWFTLNYDAILVTPDRDRFELRGQGVRVQSENELLAEQGRRVHTGKSDALNRRFARSFTENFPALAAKYPVYAELRNLFDLAMVSALITSEDLASRAGWHMRWFGDPRGYPVAVGPAPTTVETVINHRVIRRRHIVAGASGGVSVNPWKWVDGPSVRPAVPAVAGRAPADVPARRDRWWWD